MKILPNNLKRQYDLYAEKYQQKALQVLDSGWYILGNEVSSFENEWAQYIGSKYCVGLASGLDALWISFRLLGIGTGDEVIVSGNAYIACVMSITMNGATPIFIEPDAYENIDAEKIETAITEKTKAILAVHLYGQTCNMDRIMEIAHKYHLKVVEDCAQSHGSLWDGKMAGSFGDVGCFSYYPTKGCGAFGDAGSITTDDPELAEQFKIFRNYGSQKRYQNLMVGTNSRMDELQAGLLRIKLAHLDEMNRERDILAARYTASLDASHLLLPKERDKAKSTWHQYVIHVLNGKRQGLIDHLNSHEIGTIIHYPIPPYLSDAYAYLGKSRGFLPITESYADEVLSIPMYNGMTEAEQSFVIEKINAFFR